MYKEGERVKMTFYGKEVTGTVSRDQHTQIVWVLWDTLRLRWAHVESLTRIKKGVARHVET